MAFLKGDLTEEICMNQPEGFVIECLENKVLSDVKSMLAKEFDMKDLSVVDTILYMKVFEENAVNGKGDEDLRLLILGVHAVFLEFGFVGLNPSTGYVIDGFRLPKKGTTSPIVCIGYTRPHVVNSDGKLDEVERGFRLPKKGLSIRYTIPDRVNSDGNFVVLKFQFLGEFMIVYGSLSGKCLANHRLSLDASRFLPSLDFVRRNGSSESTHENEVLELWKIVKDRLSLPLLISFCENNGVSPPSYFMGLPTDLKGKILELLPGIDIGKMASVCSELKYLSSKDDLWKQKFLEEFGQLDERRQGSSWKEKFAKKMEKVPVHRMEFPYYLHTSFDVPQDADWQ
ncbi:F-box protein SKIP22-like [Tasmannia lanceolata]|uniref:F-box protein SKIP22-like n=1 Tax=Tasmannia lanceolata TaxID=3420 RepID=UPI004063B568